MEEIKKLEKVSQSELELSKTEKIIAKELKNAVKYEIKRAKIREDLVKSEYELAKIKDRLHQKTKKYIEKKLEIKEELGYSEKGLTIELNHAKFNERESEMQIQIAEIHKKIAQIELDIAEDRLKLVNNKLKVANVREKLAKKQDIYIDLFKSSAAKEKIDRAKETYLMFSKDLKKTEKELQERNREIMKEYNELSDCKKELSLKLAEREKIRPEIQNVQKE
jgi:chromosome segregation ATPase